MSRTVTNGCKMLRILTYDNGKVVNATWIKAKRTKKSWIDVVDPTEQDINAISEFTSVPIHYIGECIDEDERPRSRNFGQYSVVLFRAPYTHKNSIKISTVTFIVSHHHIITLHKREIGGIKKSWDFSESKKALMFMRGPGYILFQIIDEFLKDFQNKMESIEDQISRIEKKMFSGNSPDASHTIFTIKKTLIFFRKTFSTNRDVITNIEKGYAEGINKKDLVLFRDTYNDLIELIDMEGIYSNILTGCLEIQMSSISNKLNVVMQRLTVVTAFLLFPTLVSGIYGMNFHYMPELEWKYGYLFAWGTIIISFTLLFIYFKRKDWF